MRKLIDGLIYDTSTATLIAEFPEYPVGKSTIVRLYRTPKGNIFYTKDWAGERLARIWMSEPSFYIGVPHENQLSHWAFKHGLSFESLGLREPEEA